MSRYMHTEIISTPQKNTSVNRRIGENIVRFVSCPPWHSEHIKAGGAMPSTGHVWFEQYSDVLQPQYEKWIKEWTSSLEKWRKEWLEREKRSKEELHRSMKRAWE